MVGGGPAGVGQSVSGGCSPPRAATNSPFDRQPCPPSSQTGCDDVLVLYTVWAASGFWGSGFWGSGRGGGDEWSGFAREGPDAGAEASSLGREEGVARPGTPERQARGGGRRRWAAEIAEAAADGHAAAPRTLGRALEHWSRLVVSRRARGRPWGRRRGAGA